MAEIVKVACHVPNGLMIQLTKPGVEGGMGPVRDGAAVRLNGPPVRDTGAGSTERPDLPPGETKVDADWMRRWMDQNANNPLVSMKQVVVLDEEGADYPNPTR